MSYQGRNSSPSLTSTATWSLIALAISACSLAVVSSRWYREEKRRGYRNASDWRPGLPVPLSSKDHLLALRTMSRDGSGMGYRNGSINGCASSSPKKEFIPLNGGISTEEAPTRKQLSLSRAVRNALGIVKGTIARLKSA